MNDPRANTIYDFEGDDDDCEEYESYLRWLYPVEEYPVFDSSEDSSVGSRDDLPNFRNRYWWKQRFENGK